MCRNEDGTVDRLPWTQAERDERDRALQRRNPRLVFSPSTAQIQALFGDRNRRDREAA
jgi:hypothetical protein